MDIFYQKQYTILDAQTDCFGRLKPSAMLFFAQDSASDHCLYLNADWDTLAEKRLFWAVIRQRFQITRLPKAGETITVETWPMPTSKVAYPRSTVAYDQNGNELFRSIALWVLMNLDTRAMVLPSKSGVEVLGNLRGGELAAPNSLLPKQLQDKMQRQVLFDLLDKNGHMNNTRYLDWIFDLLPSRFHKEHDLQDLTVCYMSEAMEGEQITLHHLLNEEGILQVEADRPDGEQSDKTQRVFAAQLSFGKHIL